MKLTETLLRFSNYLRLKRVPGNILIGKHRIWPKLTPKHKRYLMNRIETEIENMKYIGRPYLTTDEEAKADKASEYLAKREDEQRIESIRANKNKIEDKFISKHLDTLRNHRTFE